MCASWLALVRTMIQFFATRLTHRELARDFGGDENGGDARNDWRRGIRGRRGRIDSRRA